MAPEFTPVVAIAAAALGGAAVGVERQWSGHATGPAARFGGVRTFTLLGGLAGIAGTLASGGNRWLAVCLVAAAATLVIAGYVAASRREVDATTEVAGLVVIGAGVLDGLGELRLGSGVIALTCLLLVEKSRLHALVRRIDDVELRAGARFAVMAMVVLPLLPPGPLGPLGGVRPQALWALVLVFSGLSFAGYAATRAIGPRHGHTVAGVLGGLVSSTGLTLAFARASRDRPDAGRSLGIGVVAACTVMFVRLLAATALLAPQLAPVAAPALLLPAAAGALYVAVVGRGAARAERAAAGPGNPLQLVAALQMAALFQAVLTIVHLVRARWGDTGLLATSALVGLTDTDALTLAATQAVKTGTSLATGARALALGCLANTVFKGAAAVTLGHGRFRGVAAAGASVLAVATVAGLALVRG